MATMLDLLVIGAGLAGLTAALAAAEAGLRTTVVAAGLGALHWSAGTLDLLGFLPDDEQPISHPLAALTRLPAAHPYRLLGRERVEASLAWLSARLEQAGLPYGGAGEQANLLLPSPAGAMRPVYLAPVAQLGGRLDDPAPLLIVGFQGFRDFYPSIVAHHLCRQGIAARAIYLPGELLSDRREANGVVLAREMESTRRQETLANALRQVAAPGERIGLPALLGLDRHMESWMRLQEVIGAPVFELPTLPPSVAGIRLHRALVELLSRRRVPIQTNMRVVRFGVEQDTGGERLAWVETESSARPLRHRAGAFLLATGGVLGGGFQSDPAGRVWETVFDLPLSVPHGRNGWFHGEFLDRRGHPVFQGGVVVDETFRPLRASAPAYANLYAAGGVLAHADPIRERSLEGIAVATGQAAVHALLTGRAESGRQHRNNDL
jgi:glycerol-3-phosphate dehydrogenase subunit B